MFVKRREKSTKSEKFKKIEEVVLPNAKLRFCPEQLQNLNFMFNENLQGISTDKKLTLCKSVTERLLQRLLCAAANIDKRFSSKFLVSNKYKKRPASASLEYILRLDSLSLPKLYESDKTPDYSVIEKDSDFPPGYARLRLNSSTLKKWSDCSNPNGYLRRDKVQAKLVELLAQAAGQESPISPLYVDEATCSGIPGKIVNPAVLHNILNIPTNEQVFYGPAGNMPRFPDPRDFRLAIIDEPSGVKVKVEFLSPALCNISVNVLLLIAIGLDSWPSTSDFPSRVPLGHPDCLLYHQAAQTGMYLVGYGVHSSAWQMRVPAAEYVLLNHYGINSTVNTVLEIIYNILDEIDHNRRIRKILDCHKILNKYILLTSVLEELETNSQTPFIDMLNWSPLFLSTHILKILDNLIFNLQREFQPNYFFKKANLMLNPGHLTDDDFTIEANYLKSYMVKLFDESLAPIRKTQEFQSSILSQETEISLLFKWNELVNNLLPPISTRSRRFCFTRSRNSSEVVYTQYTNRQLEYIGLLLKNMLGVKQKIIKDQTVAFLERISQQENFENKDNNLEDVIYILVTIMDQARDQYILKQSNPNILKNKSKIKSNYNHYTMKLVEIVRKDTEIQTINLENDIVLVKTILKWLYKAMDHNKRHLGPILRPYLTTIFHSSHSTSCQLENIKQRMVCDEIEALGTFCKLVNSGQITPAQGLVDSVNKNWNWAKDMLSIVEKHTLRLVFISEKDRVYRHILSLPSYQNKDAKCGTLDETKGKCEIRRQKTLPNRSYFNSIINEKKDIDEDIPQHDRLRHLSPLTLSSRTKHRRGQHRGMGDIFKSMASLQKLNMFQDAASSLPQEERLELNEYIQNLSSSKLKKSLNKRWSATLPNLNTIAKFGETVQRYIPKEESAGIKNNENYLDLKLSTCSLLGTCRAARIRDDSNVFLLEENFKIKKILNKSESFKF